MTTTTRERSWIMDFRVLVKSWGGSGEKDLADAREIAQQVEQVLDHFQPNSQLIVKEVRFMPEER